MLADARFPAGGHAHSGGLEGAVSAGTVGDVRSLDLFLRGRLATSGVVAAALAAAACVAGQAGADGHAGAERPGQEDEPGPEGKPGHAGESGRAGVLGPVGEPGRANRPGAWAWLDAEADARTPSPAQREASRRQGRALLRAARTAWPAPWLDDLATAGPPHHAVVLGATAAAAGCSPGEAALVAVYLTVTGPASAAVRLLALDPIEVSAVIARLAGHIEAAAERGAVAGRGPHDGPRDDAAETASSDDDELPYPSAPALDLYAEAHARAEVRLFAS